MTVEWWGFERAPEEARGLLRSSLQPRVESPEFKESMIQRFEEAVRAGAALGGLYVVGSRPVGLAWWHAEGPIGAVVDALALDPAHAAPEAYTDLLDQVEARSGGVACLAGPLPGLPLEAEDRLLRGRGYRPFARSEMRWDPARLPAPRPPAPGVATRPGARTDLEALARLHAAAYRGRFDRYLFLEEWDEAEDARRSVTGMFDGRYGPVSTEGTRVAVEGGRAVGAVISVSRPEGTLIADVMVDPQHQGRGIGELVLRSALAGLATSAPGPVFLNVTEGNAPALRLYQRLGFVRSIGPSQDWYDARRIPVGPDAAQDDAAEAAGGGSVGR